jgi:hypothetical protein
MLRFCNDLISIARGGLVAKTASLAHVFRLVKIESRSFTFLPQRRRAVVGDPGSFRMTSRTKALRLTGGWLGGFVESDFVAWGWLVFFEGEGEEDQHDG